MEINLYKASSVITLGTSGVNTLEISSAISQEIFPQFFWQFRRRFCRQYVLGFLGKFFSILRDRPYMTQHIRKKKGASGSAGPCIRYGKTGFENFVPKSFRNSLQESFGNSLALCSLALSLENHSINPLEIVRAILLGIIYIIRSVHSLRGLAVIFCGNSYDNFSGIFFGNFRRIFCDNIFGKLSGSLSENSFGSFFKNSLGILWEVFGYVF